MSLEKFVLGAEDYSILGATLLVSSLIGIYFQFTSQKKTNDEYLLADKGMSILPVAFSLMATFFSAPTLMGIPAEMYLYGTNMAFMNMGFILGPIISAFVFLPVFINNNVSTSYEYLEKRFGKVIRKIISSIFAVETILFTGVSVYAPALALSAVTNLSLSVSIISIGAVSTFYGTIGGMKAVVWAVVFQTILMFVALIAIIVKGCLDLGGAANIFSVSYEGGRLIFPKFSFDMMTHYTFFNILFQGLILATHAYGGEQTHIQRLLTLKTLKKSQIATLLSIPMIVAFQLLCCFCGLIFYVYFRLCDPLSSSDRPIVSPDQLMPYYITSTMSVFPGLPGLCVAGIFSSSLCTVSSSVNSLASITVEDFLKPILPKVSKSVLATGIISLLYGLVCIGFSFLLASLGNLIRMTLLIVGMFAGPSLGVFILAACTTVTNEEGAVIGVLSGVLVAACLSFIPEQIMEPPLNLSNECPNSTLNTFSVPEETTFEVSEKLNGEEKFHLAYMWISSIALLTCLISGYIASLIMRYFKGPVENIPDIYLSPIRVWISNKINKKEKTEDRIQSQHEDCTKL